MRPPFLHWRSRRQTPIVRELRGGMATDEEGALRRLVDKDEIVDLVHRYSYGVDHRLYDEVVELFTEDCVVDYGPAFAPVHGRAALRKMFGSPGVGFAATSHHNANVLVTFDERRSRLGARVGVCLAPAGGRHDSAVVGLLPRRGRARCRGMEDRGRASFACSASRTGTSNGIGRSIRPSRSRHRSRRRDVKVTRLAWDDVLSESDRTCRWLYRPVDRQPISVCRRRVRSPRRLIRWW